MKEDEPIQDELFQSLTKVEGPRRYRMPKFPPAHGGLHWVKPQSWGQVTGQKVVLVAFPEEWIPGRPITTMRDLMMKPDSVTVSLERGGLIEAETLMSLRVLAKEKEALKRSLHGG